MLLKRTFFVESTFCHFEYSRRPSLLVELNLGDTEEKLQPTYNVELTIAGRSVKKCVGCGDGGFCPGCSNTNYGNGDPSGKLVSCMPRAAGAYMPKSLTARTKD